MVADEVQSTVRGTLPWKKWDLFEARPSCDLGVLVGSLSGVLHIDRELELSLFQKK